jgi:Tol biopolymer transport system component/DNA-binding winged helix-turn-helix (wHTH) protein
MSIIEEAVRISFGLFEVDLQAGELWKAGFKVRLPGQPFKVLTTLLARHGEVVTREELQIQVWGTNTNVDFERALAGAINKIREALGDSAENPRYVQTLPKRGYRFIAPVSVIQSATKVLQNNAPPVEVNALFDDKDKSSTGDATILPVSTTIQVADYSSSEGLSPSKKSRLRSQRSGAALIAMLTGSVVLLGCVIALAIWRLKWQPEPAPLRVDVVTRSGAIYAGPPNLENLLTLATDGNRILTSVMKSGRPVLSAVSISTGEVEAIPLPQELASSSLADISRDAARLLLKGHLSSSSEQPLWIVPSSGGSALRVGSVLAHDASWMPDGTSILYANGNDLAVTRLSDGVSTPFAHLNGRAFWMRWSPDGKLLRFTLVDPVTHTLGIWQLKNTGGTPQRILTPESDRLSACCGSWTADGSAYVLQAGGDLWQIKGNGRTAMLAQLTNGPLRFLSPVTARSGSRIFFLGLDQPQGMQEFDVKTGFHPAPSYLANATRVDFSRDGRWVAWSDNDGRLWRAQANDGSDKVQLTPEYLEVFMAHWSPDGKQLAVMAREGGKVWRTYLIDAGGGTPKALLNEDRNAADPGWSSDGKSLVFGREPDSMGKESGSHAIQILHLDTMKAEIVPGSEGMFSPRWSPDGRWIAALTLDQKSLMLYELSQKHWKELARTSAADPIWSADSKSIYVHAFLEDKQPILKINIPTGDIHLIADLNSFRDQATINYFFGGLTPQDEPLIQPRIGTGDLYTLNLRDR